MLLSQTCPICNAISKVPCAECVAKLEPALPLQIASEFELGCRALYAYSEASSRLVLTLKYRRDISLVRWLAPGLSELVPQMQIDCLTWIPAATKNLRKRGYDQSELLAKAVARQVGLPCRKLLSRRKDASQYERSFQERLVGPTVSIANPRAASLNFPKSILIVDDVITTGSSLRRSAEVLREAGAMRLGAIAVAGRSWRKTSGSSNRSPNATRSTEQD